MLETVSVVAVVTVTLPATIVAAVSKTTADVLRLSEPSPVPLVPRSVVVPVPADCSMAPVTRNVEPKVTSRAVEIVSV